MKLDSEIVGRALLDCRKAAGLSQSEVAKVMGISQQQIAKYERGMAGISLIGAISFCQATGASPVELMAKIINQEEIK